MFIGVIFIILGSAGSVENTNITAHVLAQQKTEKEAQESNHRLAAA